MRIIKEKAGVISPEECWVILHKCWMYGPHPKLWQCVRDMIFEWKHDINLVG